MKFLLVLCLMFSSIAFAQQPLPADIPPGTISVTAPVIETQPTPPKAVSFLQSVQDKIPSDIPLWLVGCLVFAVEFLVRVAPTAKPRSILIVVSSALNLVASISSKLSALLDKFLQNIKPTVP